MNFIFQICDANEGYVGKHNVLKFIEHSNRGLNENADRKHIFHIPLNADLLFYRHWYWDTD